MAKKKLSQYNDLATFENVTQPDIEELKEDYHSYMVNYVYLVVACVLSIELFLRLKFMSYVNSIGRNSNKVFRVIISSNISDHWKEKMVPVYAFILLKNSLLILGILFLIILVFSAFIVLSSKFLSLILSVTGVATSIVISLTYLKLRVTFFE